MTSGDQILSMLKSILEHNLKKKFAFQYMIDLIVSATEHYSA